jgi:hypothetical protein
MPLTKGGARSDAVAGVSPFLGHAMLYIRLVTPYAATMNYCVPLYSIVFQ